MRPTSLFRNLSLLVFAGLCSAFFVAEPGHGQSMSGVQILAKVDRHLSLPNGLARGKLTVIHNTGRTRILKFDLYKDFTDSLYVFASRRRGVEQKILYNESGEVVWVFDALSQTMFQKRDVEKYTRALNSGYSYIDISYYPLKSNYQATNKGTETFEGKKYMKLELKPLRPRAYKHIIALVDAKNDYRPVRFDFVDRKGIMVKSMTFQFREVRMIGKNRKRTKKLINSRRDLIHLHSGTISILEMSSHDMSVKVDKSIYRNYNLNK